MATEVLLMANVKDLGDEGDIVTVADGYARNYLLPKNLAAPATEITKRRLEKIRREREGRFADEVEVARALAVKMAETSYTITVKVGDEDRMYGSVTNADIADTMAAQGFKVDKHSIVLDSPIKDLGVYDVPVKLHAEVDAIIKLWIVEE